MEAIRKHILEIPASNASENWSQKIEFLYQQQLQDWTMAKNHYSQLKSIEQRSISFDKFRIEIQHNPARARSTCADLSQKTIKKRPCFLCVQNLPNEQKGYLLMNKYLVLINPFPIFHRHLTISDFKHTPQKIETRITDLLSIAKDLNDFTIFYNGPRCGASAPDHFHFQAAQKGKMPIDDEIKNLSEAHKNQLFKNEDLEIYDLPNYLRTVIVFESKYMEPIDYFFAETIKQLPFDSESNEAMLNVMASYEQGMYRLILFPRQKQRPDCYFKQDPDRILVSPASVELGGIIITPREIDYTKISSENIREIYREVSSANPIHFF